MIFLKKINISCFESRYSYKKRTFNLITYLMYVLLENTVGCFKIKGISFVKRLQVDSTNGKSFSIKGKLLLH